MIWRSSYHSKIAQLADFFTTLIGFFLTYFVTTLLNKINPVVFPSRIEIQTPYFVSAIVISVTYVILFNSQKAYSYQRFTSLLKEYSIILKVTSLGILLNISVFYLLDLKQIPRTFIITYFILNIFLFISEKTLLFYVAAYIREKGRNRKRVLLIGTGTRAKQFIETVQNNFKWGLDIVGLLTGDIKRVGETVDGVKIIATYSEIENILKTYNPEEIVITISTKRFDQIREIFEQCESMGVSVRLNSDFFGHVAKNVSVDNLFGLNIISFYPTRLSEWDMFIKRIIDFSVSLVVLILLSPVFLMISMLIFLQDGLPILYKWKIVGYNRKPITSWKFRTMIRNADELKNDLQKKNEMSGPVFKLTNDPRVLPVGKFLRKYSLDELPQLLSVLKGDLSLVGPRPPLQYEFKEFDLWHRRKLSVKPGITCLWQINGRNKINDFNEWARLDLQYIDHWSIWLDLKILLKTIPAVLSGKGAK